MKIKNANGEVTLTPKSQSKKEMKDKFKGKKFTTLTRAEKDELLVLLCKLNGVEVD